MAARRNTESFGRGRGGFTIVELLVAAVIMLIATLAVVVVTRKSSDIEVEGHHTRQARMIMTALLEDVFDYRYYPNAYGKFGIKPGAVAFDTSFTVVIDSRGAAGIERAEPLMGTLSVWVWTDDIRGDLDPPLPFAVPVDKVKMKMNWTEPDGTPDSVILYKTLAGTD